jgi:hypothetical protein
MPAATETRKECLSSIKEAFMKRLMALTLGIVAASALAQAAPSTANPDAGFFRPDDLAVPKAAAQPRPGDSIADMRKAEVALRIEEETLRIEEEALRIENGNDDRIERQMDRVERENERERNR